MWRRRAVAQNAATKPSPAAPAGNISGYWDIDVAFFSKPGDSITFTFSGSLSGDTFSGPVYMEECLNAKLTAKRHTYQDRRGNILIPGGPPMAN